MSALQGLRKTDRLFPTYVWSVIFYAYVSVFLIEIYSLTVNMARFKPEFVISHALRGCFQEGKQGVTNTGKATVRKHPFKFSYILS